MTSKISKTLLIVSLCLMGCKQQNEEKNSSVIADNQEKTTLTPTFNNSTEVVAEEEIVEDAFDADEFKVWIKDTYGNNKYLSKQFRSLLQQCEEACEKTGYIIGPDFDYWWWNQDPSEKLSVESVDRLDENQLLAVVIADGTRLFIQIINEEGQWVYADFVDEDKNSYIGMMKSDLSEANTIE